MAAHWAVAVESQPHALQHTQATEDGRIVELYALSLTTQKPNAAKVPRNPLVLSQHWFDARFAEAQVDRAYNPRAQSARAVPPGLSLNGDALDELGLSHWPELSRPVSARPPSAAGLHITSMGDVVASSDVLRDLFHHVATDERTCDDPLSSRLTRRCLTCKRKSRWMAVLLSGGGTRWVADPEMVVSIDAGAL